MFSSKINRKERIQLNHLTSAHIPAAPLRGGIPALAVCAAVGRPGVGAVAEAPVHALGRARGPRRPFCPSAGGS